MSRVFIALAVVVALAGVWQLRSAQQLRHRVALLEAKVAAQDEELGHVRAAFTLQTAINREVQIRLGVQP